MRAVPVVLRKRKSVQGPGEVRRRISCGYALQRHRRASLDGLLDEFVHKLRRRV